MNGNKISGLSRFVQKELLKEAAYLLPLRLFLGLGWIRASVEKLIDPGWYDGTALRSFLEEQLAGGYVVFPFYRVIVVDVFLPNASVLSWTIMVGQLLAGTAILVGFFTNAALLGGLFMNLNFILAGQVTPSAFYFVIQVALLLGGIGAILGLDSWTSRRVKNPLLVAKIDPRSRHFRTKGRVYLGLSMLMLVLAAYALAHVSTFDPGLSVEDPAMILVVLFALGSVQALVSYSRQRPPASEKLSSGEVG